MSRDHDPGVVLKSAISLSNFYVFAVVNVAMAPIVLIAGFHREVADQFGVHETLVSSLYGLFFVVGGCFNFWTQKHQVRLAIRLRCVLAGALLSIGLFICSICDNFSSFGISFIVIVSALGGAFFLAPIAAFAMTRTGSASALALGIASAGQLTAFGFWAFALRSLEIHHWRPAFEASAFLVAALSAFGLIALVPTRMTITLAPPIEKGRLAARHLFVAYTLVCFTATALILFISTTITAEGLPPVYLFSASALVGRVVIPAIFDMGFRRCSIVAAAFLFALGMLSLLFIPISSATVVTGFGYGALLPVLMAFVFIRYPAHKTQSSYEMFAFGSVGMLVAPFANGLVDSVGVPARTFVVLAVPLMAIFAFYFIMDRRGPQ